MGPLHRLDAFKTGLRKRQKVWDHFKLKQKENSVQLVYCNLNYLNTSTTTSMLQHLNRKHPVQGQQQQPVLTLATGSMEC